MIICDLCWGGIDIFVGEELTGIDKGGMWKKLWEPLAYCVNYLNTPGYCYQ